MALVRPLLFQVAGYQNSGKTTLSLRLIQQLTAAGLKVATIKHHGHGGRPEVVESKDSDKHVKAGAAVSLVEGGGRLVIQAENGSWSLSEEIDMLSFFKPDLILIEGHKQEPYPKAVILRNEDDIELMEKLENIQVVLCRDPELVNILKDTAVPVLDMEDGVDWITTHISNNL
ncbi:molybdopterin-guanine dinucleotide biosynthesis protein B [Mesobacillus jeotgali]|jgi:molybdopterin-guanine dinucleotide biosynthesis adapter protein|uniref:Molybdopterin-guanine dinucleotide biosynthesis protein B n=1 Tax=Mesobacillus jeotgali TaxID=129985 RepID=A0ABY9VLT7_9BACI|nr:molybdopterin-guanine dinucleotide biosynthesis protein B [Mesobacillus jeotgali]WNF24104.1 molybdopterin-guanine dinucleotide biosynthesis protein B [Mesobacillus jeotgali]